MRAPETPAEPFAASLSTRAALALGVASLWPLIGMAGLLILVPAGDLGALATRSGAAFVLLAGTAFLTVALLVGLVVLDVWIALTSERVAHRALWVAALFLGSVAALPAFFLAQIWPARCEGRRRRPAR